MLDRTTAAPPTGGMGATHRLEPDRAHQLATHALSVQGNLCRNVRTSDTCHNRFATGCTVNNSNDPNTYDAYLNFLKNQTPDPGLADGTMVFTKVSDFTDLDDKTRALGLGGGHQAAFADDLAELQEGNFVALVGYLYFAQFGGRPETCNCKLTGDDEIDFHLGIGFDEQMANDIADGTFVVATGRRTDEAKQTSIVVEMTPHYRDMHHPNWTLATLQTLAGQRVKVVGQLLLDNEHNKPADNCFFPNADRSTCFRASAWEIHPVMRFFVCKPNTNCRPESDDDWDELDPE
jgi:hypothetical protein